MIRIVIGAILGGLAQFIVGAIAWTTIANSIAYKHLTDATMGDLHVSLARTLSPTGTGTYFIPDPSTPAATALFGRGPVALIFFNASGFPMMKPSALLVGLILSIGMLLLVGLALRHVRGFAEKLQVAGLFGVATVVYFVLSLPVYNFYMPWSWWVFLAIQELLAFAAGAFILIRWFMPESAAPATLH